MAGEEQQIDESRERESGAPRIDAYKLFDTAFKLQKENPDKKNPILPVIGLLHPKPQKEWGVDEYAHVMYTLGISEGKGTKDEEEVLIAARKLVLDTAESKNLNKNVILNKRTDLARQHPQERTFADIGQTIEAAIKLSDRQDIFKKKKEVLSLYEFGPEAEESFKPVFKALEKTQVVDNVEEVNAEEIASFTPEDIPSTDDKAFDKKFQNIVNTVKSLSDDSDLELLQNIFEKEKVDILINGKPQHQYFVNLLAGRIDQLRQKQEQNKFMATQLAKMSAASDGRLEIQEGDRRLYGGAIDETLQERMDRIRDESGRWDDDDKVKYYNNLRRWVGVILGNDERTEGKLHGLHLSDERYDRFKKIFERDPDTMSMDEIRKEVEYLNRRGSDGENISRYFKKKVENVVALQGNGRINLTEIRTVTRMVGNHIRSEEELEQDPRYQSYGIPETLDQTVDMITAQYGRHYPINTGEEYELIDVEGKFHIENFHWWVRNHATYLAGENPMSEIQPLTQIVLKAGFTQVSLLDIVYSDQFRQQSKFVITGDDEDEKGIINGTWGRKEEHEEFPRQRAELLLYETAYFALGHNSSAGWKQAVGDRDGFFQAVKKFSSDSFISRGNWTVFAQMPARGEGSDKEFKEVKDGTLGRAMREMLVAYGHVTDFTEFFKYHKDDRRVRDKIGEAEAGKEKRFEHNMLYTFLEANGTNTFLQTLSAEALKEHPEIEGQYKKFILQRLEASQSMYESQDLSDDKKKELAQIIQRFKVGVDKNPREFAIGSPEFDTNELLLKFHEKVAKVIFHEKINPEKRKEIKEDVKKDMLAHIKEDFFEPIKSVKIDLVGKLTDKRTGETKPLGEMEFDGVTMSDIIDAVADLNTYENYNKYVDYKPDEEPDTSDPEFIKYYKANEKLAVALTEILTNIDRKDINQFRGARGSGHSPSRKTALDTAIQRAVAEKAFGLDRVEAEYSWTYAKDYLMPLGIAGQLDTVGIGFDYWTKLTRLKENLTRQMYRGFPIIHEIAHGEFNFLGMHMLEMMNVKTPGEHRAEHSLFSLFEGREHKEVKRRKDRTLEGEYSMTDGAQLNVINQHLDNASQFYERLKNGEFNFAEVVKNDPLSGNVIIDKPKLVEIMAKLWTNIRYATDQQEVDYSRIINRDGREDDILHHMLGPKTRTILEKIQQEQFPVPEKITDDETPEKKFENLRVPYTSPGIGLFCSLLGAVIKEHRDDPSEHRWTMDMVRQVEWEMVHAHQDPSLTYGTRIPPKIFDALLNIYETSYSKMMVNDTALDSFLSLFVYSFMEAGKEFFEQLPQGRH